jgi:hypothetical protein
MFRIAEIAGWNFSIVSSWNDDPAHHHVLRLRLVPISAKGRRYAHHVGDLAAFLNISPVSMVVVVFRGACDGESRPFDTREASSSRRSVFALFLRRAHYRMRDRMSGADDHSDTPTSNSSAFSPSRHSTLPCAACRAAIIWSSVFLSPMRTSPMESIKPREATPLFAMPTTNARFLQFLHSPPFRRPSHRKPNNASSHNIAVTIVYIERSSSRAYRWLEEVMQRLPF